jgi:uncharacterized protein (DUF1786 family)
MSNCLAVDIGAGTMDILYYDFETREHYKAVVKSPAVSFVEKIREIQGPLVISGKEMGGGKIKRILAEKARQYPVIMTKKAAATIHHDEKKVSALGIDIIEEKDVEKYILSDMNHVKTEDIDVHLLKSITDSFGVPFSFDIVGICAQDHGWPPKGESHLDFRNHIFSEALQKTSKPERLLYKEDEVPVSLNRLSSIAETARCVPAEEVYVMDSGMAAIAGGCCDSHVRQKEVFTVIDVATSHTLIAAVDNEEIAAFVEYHTRDISGEIITEMIIRVAQAEAHHDQILKQGGHGAYIHKKAGISAIQTVVVTGPKRHMVLKEKKASFIEGAPMGDTMMTGTTGIIDSIMKRKYNKSIKKHLNGII